MVVHRKKIQFLGEFTRKQYIGTNCLKRETWIVYRFNGGLKVFLLRLGIFYLLRLGIFLKTIEINNYRVRYEQAFLKLNL